MPNLAELMSLERRRLILDALAENGGNPMNERSLKLILQQFGHMMSGEQVRAEMQAMAAHRLIETQIMGGGGIELWMANMTQLGEDVQRGCAHVAVARPNPRR